MASAGDAAIWERMVLAAIEQTEPETVARATPEMMRMIQKKYYVPNNSALVVSGDVSAAEIFRMAEEIFGGWPRGEDPFVKDPIPKHPPLMKDTVAIVNQPVNATTIQLGYHGPSTDTDAVSTYAADVFSFILRQPNSRFSRALVDSGLTTGAGLNYYTQLNVGPISLMAQTTPEKLKGTIAEIKDRKSTRLNSSHIPLSRMPSSA